MKTIKVVAAIICDGEKIFATQRGYGDWKDYWEFPGGKIEAGETPEEALRREILEELDTGIAVGEKLTTIEYDYPEFHLSMECFPATVTAGNLVLKEHEAARWLTPEDLDSVRWLPADQIIIELLKKRMNRREQSSRQERIAALIGILFNTGLVLAGLDQRFGWTKLPVFLKLSAACLMLSSYGICLLTARVNPFLSRTVEVREGQTAVDTGPYRIVRHPMYAGTSLFFAAVPLLLDSWIAFFAFLPLPFLLCRRLLEEEKMLEEGLAGYREYMKRVKYRLIPGIW